MRSPRLRLLAGICLLGFIASAEINPGASSILRDGDKGQPELHQPLDNNPYRWNVVEDENILRNGEDNYPEILTKKTMDLLSEAVKLLGRVRDVKSKQWLEAFITKIGQLAVELEESTKNDDKLSVAHPTEYPIVPTASPLIQDVTRSNKATGKFHVTAPQLSDVLQNNEEFMSKQVVTRPGIVSNASEEEDEIVRQLHEQDLQMEFKKKDPQIRVVVHHHLPNSMKTTTAPPIEENTSDSVQLDEKEKQLLLQLLQEMDEFPDFDAMEHHQEKNLSSKTRTAAGVSDSNKFSLPKQDEMGQENEFELEEDMQSDPQGYNSNSETDTHDLNSFLPSTNSPDVLKTTDKSSLDISQDFPLQQLSEKHAQHQQIPNNSGLQHIPLQKQNTQSTAYQPPFLPYPMDEQASSHHRPLSVHNNYFRRLTKNHHSHPTQTASSHKDEQTHMLSSPHENKFYHHLPTKGNPQKHFKYPHEHSAHQNNFPSNHRQWESSSQQQSNEKARKETGSEIYNHTHPQIIPANNEPLNPKRILGTKSKNTRYHYHQQRQHSPNPFHKHIYAADTKPVPPDPENTPNEDEEYKKSTNTMRLKNMPFQNNMESSVQLEDDLQRQLRAGKVVLLSDSVVRTNFDKHPTKDKKTDNTAQNSVTAREKQNDETEEHDWV